MKNWQEHWNTYPQTFLPQQYLSQVGKTVGGQPISQAQFEALLADICNGLKFKSTDHVLDLCCGNGVITKNLSTLVSTSTGIDYSGPLIEVARNNHQSANINYLHASILEMGSLQFEDKFSAIYMYEALQHFTAIQFSEILNLVKIISSNDCRIFLGSIPNVAMRWKFYNTWSRRLDFVKRSLFSEEAIGKWWSKSEIEKIAGTHGYQCEFRAQNKLLHTAHYRFDVLLTPKTVNTHV